MGALKFVLVLTFILLLIAFAIPPSAPATAISAPVLNAMTTQSCNGYYILQSGDTLASLAARCNITVADILAANPWIRDPNLITPGVRIDLPGSDRTALEPAAPGIPATGATYLLPETGGASVANGAAYTVVAGDTLGQIAARYNTTLAVLIQLNPAITHPDQIYTGQILVLP